MPVVCTCSLSNSTVSLRLKSETELVCTAFKTDRRISLANAAKHFSAFGQWRLLYLLSPRFPRKRGIMFLPALVCLSVCLLPR